MGDLTKNFSRHEFCTNDKARTPWPDSELQALQRLADTLQVVRDTLAMPITVVSAYRHLAYNTKVGSKPTSQHTERNSEKDTPPCAADIRCGDDATEELYKLILHMIRSGQIPNGGVGVYPRSNFVHIDDRCHYGIPKARWRQKA